MGTMQFAAIKTIHLRDGITNFPPASIVKTRESKNDIKNSTNEAIQRKLRQSRNAKQIAHQQQLPTYVMDIKC